MTRKTIAIWAAIPVAAWFLVPPLLGFRSWEWHQKLVLEVNTPHGLVSGGSTIAAGVSLDPKWLPSNGGGGHSWIKGESSFVEISPGKYLFAVLRDQDEIDRAVHSFASQIHAFDGTTEQIFHALETTQGTGRVPRPYYPSLVVFDGLSDPSSVRAVDPDHLEAIFGPGTSLKNITLEITNERVTVGPIDKILKWLPDYYAVHLDGGRYETISASNPTANSLASGAFKVP